MSKIQLHNCDCLEFMANVPDKHFDLAIVDPPYGLDLANMNMGAGKSKKSSNIRNRKWVAKDWDKKIPDEAYFNELFRVSKNQIIWGANYFPYISKQPSTTPKSIQQFKEYIKSSQETWVLWNKEIPEGMSFAHAELAWTSIEKPLIFNYSVYLNKGDKFHPTTKPVKLYEKILKTYAKEGDLIFDTHGGSFNSAKAAYNLGFDFVGCEIDQEYFEKAQQRFNLHASQSKLF